MKHKIEGGTKFFIRNAVGLEFRWSYFDERLVASSPCVEILIRKSTSENLRKE